MLTYQILHHEVCKFANVLKKLGIRHGDVVSIYMPIVPELAIAMLACADWRDAFGHLRRFFERSDRRSQQRRPGQAGDHGRRRLAARPAIAAEGQRRRGIDQERPRSKSASCCVASATK